MQGPHVNGVGVGATVPCSNGKANSNKPMDPIAIVGASCRFSGEASSISGLWNLMWHQRTACTKIPESRWNADAWHHPDPDRKGTLNTRHGHFLEQDPAAFDATFFSTSAKEAAGMDPAKRLLLEVAYEAFENAGLPMENLAGSMTGVYVGNMTRDYEVLSQNEALDIPHMAGSGTSEAMTANRLSWFFDLRGPSIHLDTACSSSLYALHLACQSLHLGETNMGLVAGVNLILHPRFMQQLAGMHMISPDGVSHSFDDRANGYGRGEGVGSLIVKRLSDAIADGDTIRAVIRGTSVNVDGRTPSVTMPSAQAQAELIRSAYNDAGLPLNETQYVELHGTGTPVGDPIEVAAIAQTFGAAASPEKPVYIGSIKPNIGHTEGCAGLAGVFKAMVSLESGIILPTAGVENLNPKLRIAESNLALSLAPLTWPSEGRRRISVNSFGFGGANAHVILDDAYHFLQEHGLTGKHATTVQKAINGHAGADADDVSEKNGDKTDSTRKMSPKKLFVFSSRDEAGIKRNANLLRPYFQARAHSSHSSDMRYTENLAYTLAHRRSIFDFRSFAVASSATELAQQLDSYIPKLKRQSKQSGIAFVFTGQGAQWPGMGRQLIQFPVFAASISRSKVVLDQLGCPFDVEFEIQNVENSSISLPEYSQPICTVVQIALVNLLAHWGIVPKAVVGHSSGEIAAACAAGIIEHDDAVKIAYLRGVYSGKASKGPKRGAMMAVGISEEECNGYLSGLPQDSVVAACINSPKSVTLSGDAEYMPALADAISKDGKFARMLHVITAYHSPHMKVVAEDCLEAMNSAGVREPRSTSILMFSSVTGGIINHDQVKPDYWVRNMCSPVRFSEAVTNMLTYSENKRRLRKTGASFNILTEIGPHAALKGPLTQIMDSIDRKMPSEVHYMSMLLRKEDAVSTALQAAGQYWALGLPILLSKVNQEAEAADGLRTLVDLPSYSFNHDKTYWHEPANMKASRLRNKPRTDLLGLAVEGENLTHRQWRNVLRARENPWVEDHKITGTTLYPGAGMLIMVVEAAQEIANNDAILKGIELTDIHFKRGLMIPSEDAVEVMLHIEPCKRLSSKYSFAVSSRVGEKPWLTHCDGFFSILYDTEAKDGADDLSKLEWTSHKAEFERVKELSSEKADVDGFYEALNSVGMQYGPSFRNVTSLHTNAADKTACYGNIAIPDTASTMPFAFEYPHLIHPATLDAIFHLGVAAIGGTRLTEAIVPFEMERLFISARVPQGVGSIFSGFSQKVARREGQLAADLIVSDGSWNEPMIVGQGLVLKQVASDDTAGHGSNSKSIEKLATEIVWAPDPELALSRAATRPPSLTISRLRDWLDIECHKSTSLNVLFYGTSLPVSIWDQVEPFVTGHSPYRGFARCTILDSEDALQSWKSRTASATTTVELKTWSPDTRDASTLSSDTYDIIIMGQENCRADEQEISFWKPVLHSHSRLLILGNIIDATAGSSVGFDLLDGSRLNILSSMPDSVMSKMSHVYLLIPDYSDEHVSLHLLSGIQAQLEKIGCSYSRVGLDSVPSMREACVISLLDFDNAFTVNWSTEHFETFKQLVSSTRHLFWLTRGGSMLQTSEAGLDSGPATGLLRVLRNEFPEVTLVHLDLSPSFDAGDCIQSGSLVFNAWLASQDENRNLKELELAERNGEILVPRMIASPGLDMEIALTKGTAPPQLKSLSDAGPLQLVLGGREKSIGWRVDDQATTNLEPEEVEIQVINASVDVANLGAGASTPTPQSMASLMAAQVTGRVTRCGYMAAANFKKGDLVVSLGSSSLRTHMRRDRLAVTKVPQSISTLGAATTLWSYATAIYTLKYVTKLTNSHNIFIQYNSTGLGQALVYLAQYYGANVFAGVKTSAEKDDIVNRLHIPEQSIIAIGSDYSALKSHLIDRTKGQGLDVVVTFVTDLELVHALRGSLSDFGHLALIKGDAMAASIELPALSMSGNSHLCSIDPLQLVRSKPQMVAMLLDEAKELVSTAALPGLLFREALNVSHMTNSTTQLEKDSSGVVAVEFSDDAQVPVIPAPPASLQLSQDGTYVLSGGLGSLGLRIAALMAKNGARHITFLSRSGGGRYAEELAALNKRGCETLVLKCDVVRLDDVQQVVTAISATGRLIKGVVQCAMVIQDSLFHKMTHEQWWKCFAPKVTGSWNLHTALPRDMDFFVLLSSAVDIIGNMGQANYSAANSYMDALAHFRRGLGLPATAINAGLVADDTAKVIDGTKMTDAVGRFTHLASVATSLEEIDIAVLAGIRGKTATGAAIPAQFTFTMTDSLQPEGVDPWALDAKFIHRWAGDEDQGDSEAEMSIRDTLAAAQTFSDAVVAVSEILKSLVASTLNIQQQDVDDERPLYDLGVDSLSAIEIRNMVFRKLEGDISIFEILSPSSLADLAVTIASRSKLVLVKA